MSCTRLLFLMKNLSTGIQRPMNNKNESNESINTKLYNVCSRGDEYGGVVFM